MAALDTLTALDRYYIDAMIEAHPKSIIRVTRGFFDGTERHPFGHVPHDFDGPVVEVEFRMVA